MLDQIGNHEDRFSHNEAHIITIKTAGILIANEHGIWKYYRLVYIRKREHVNTSCCKKFSHFNINILANYIRFRKYVRRSCAIFIVVKIDACVRTSPFACCGNHLSRVMRKPTFWFLTWSDTNQSVQLQKIARCLKFRI